MVIKKRKDKQSKVSVKYSSIFGEVFFSVFLQIFSEWEG